MYHHQHTGSSSYDYSSYPTTPFEQTAPPTHASGRPVRSNTSQTQSPPQPTSFQPSSTYPSSGAYASAPYGLSSAQTQQWQQEPWGSQPYAQPFTSQPMQPEMTYASSTAPRDDPVPISTPDTRTSGFAPTSMPPAQEPRRQESGYSQASLQTSSHPSPPPRNTTRRREKESPIVAPTATATASGLDFIKMQDSYRLIMDSTSNMMTSGTFSSSSSRTPSVETLERMFQSANYGVQMLQSAIAPSNPDMRPTASVGDKDAPASKRQKGDEHAQDGQTCLGCNATSTPEWRRGPLGPRTLCNACGLVYAKLLKKRARTEARARATADNGGQSSQHPIDESNALSSGGSEDEGSYGSQDRRSDFGEHGRRV